MNRQRFPNQERLLVGAVKVAGGLSYCFNQQTLLSASLLSSLLLNDRFNQYTAVGLGGSLYAQHDFSTRWRLSAEATLLHYVQGVTQTTYNYVLNQRFTLSTSQAVVLKIGRSNEFDRAVFDAQLAWQYYF
jgi:hypothetical protein